ncbi:MAG: transposase [Parasporobacterium sp.]|nr:transposase [Parasporobacterium sp.]
MRSARPDKTVKADLFKYEVDPETGEVFDDDRQTELQLKDYEGNVVLPAYSWSIGCDVHRDFIQVSVMIRVGQSVKEYHFQCDTDYSSLCDAKKLIIRMIESFSDPHVDVDPNRLRYACESTGNYHHPLLKAWGGIPIVINPSIAKAGRRKSDHIDAYVLCQNALMGVWPESFVFSDDINILRTLFQQRRHCERRANQIGNSINSELLRFGVNIGRDGSVTKNRSVREHVMDQLSDHPAMEPGKTNDFIPPEVKAILKKSYEEWDRYKELGEEYLQQIRDKIESMMWKCGDTELDGKEMISLLCTVPGIGEYTAMIWLTYIVEAHRFASYEKCIAYCGFDPSAATSAGKVVSGKKRKGNKELHEAIVRSAGTLLSRANEPFGRWAENLYNRSGKWKKASNALGRKLVTALYYVQKTGNEFDYEKYRIEEPEVIDISLDRLIEIEPAFRRYIKKIIPMNITTTQEMVHVYHICGFKRVKGLGKGFYGLVRKFIENQNEYRERYFEIYGKDDIIYDEEDRDDYNE